MKKRLCILEDDEIPDHDCIHCCICKTRVAFIHDFIGVVPDIRAGFFTKVFNVEVPHGDRYHEEAVNGPTLADNFCAQCGMLLGLKIIAVPKPFRNYQVGYFVMKLNKLIYYSDVTLLQHNEEHAGGANEQSSNDQDGGVNEQNDDEDGGTPTN